MPKVQLSDSQIVLFYGEEAVKHFIPFVNKWSKILETEDWEKVRFVLVSESEPETETDEVESEARHIIQAITRHYEPSMGNVGIGGFLSWINNQTAQINLHILYAPGGGSESIAWIETFIDNLRRKDFLQLSERAWIIPCANADEQDRQRAAQLAECLQNGQVFLLGERNANGGVVQDYARWQAAALSVLLAAAGEMRQAGKVFSLGYASLNAEEGDLDKLAENRACELLLEELNGVGEGQSSIETLPLIMPEGVNSIDELQNAIQSAVREHSGRFSPTALKNVCITTRLVDEGEVLSPAEARERLERFVNLNCGYAERDAEEYAQGVYEEIKNKLLCCAATCGINPSAVDSVIDALERQAKSQAAFQSLYFGRKPFWPGKREGYFDECRQNAKKAAEEFHQARIQTIYAQKLKEKYEQIQELIRLIGGVSEASPGQRNAKRMIEERLNTLASRGENGVDRLKDKYPDYTKKLEQEHASLWEMLNSVQTQPKKKSWYYEADGSVLQKSWDRLFSAVRGKIRGKIAGYNGTFFSALKIEFIDETARRNFLDNYLKAGPRMYWVMGDQTAGVSYLLADSELEQSWRSTDTIYSTQTDNAENLTVYPLNAKSAAEYIREDSVHFTAESSQDAGGKAVQFGTGHRTVIPKGGASSADDSPLKEDLPPVSIEPSPDGKQYFLKWDWHDKDDHAYIDLFKDGEKIGTGCVDHKDYLHDGRKTDILSRLGVRSLPAGMLEVTIIASNGETYIDKAKAMGRRPIVRYTFKGKKSLLLKGNINATVMKKLVLSSSDEQGKTTLYPLYRSGGEEGLEFEGLTLSDAKVQIDPQYPATDLYIIKD